ncbi:MAG: glycerol-3-phosphate dehydrogenase [Proteobacteria bacterium]|nr:MAG: glycerol-3-phosphate dehydrogenase [Pseudomonadota bacterium]
MAVPSLATPLRRRTLDRLEREAFDCVVIGGGITGAGVAREAAMRGLAVALVEARDFASGTSSRSSKLIHGGLRYLAMGDVALVRDTALERKRVFALAPHLAERRWMLVPARSYAGLLKFRAGLATYEALGAVEEADRHRNWNAEDLAREEPLLRRDRFPYACAYREYVTDDARLVLANLRDAVLRGAVAINHAAAVEILVQDGSAAGVAIECRASGRRVRVRARSVVNAAGPWVEAVSRLEDPGAPPRLHLSKGVHVGIAAARLPLRHVAILGAADKRSIFAIPRGGVVYLGTTDTSYGRGADEEPPVTRADVEYLLEPVPRYFAGAPPTPEDCVTAWAGLRPLLAEPGKSAVELSRRDEITRGPAGVVTIAGGKLTGYRKMGADVVAQVAEALGEPLAPARDEDAPLPGGDFDGDLDALARRCAREAGVDARTAARLVRLYGTESLDVAARGAQPLVAGGAVVAGEVDWAIDVEGALDACDVVYRRTRAALYDPDVRAALPSAVASRMAPRVGWDDARAAREAARVAAQLEADLSFREEAP